LVEETLDAAPCGMILVDGAGRIVMANPVTTEIFGYPRETLLGQPIEMLVPEHARRVHVPHRHTFYGAAHKRRLGYGRELHGLHQSGREIPLEIGLTPVVHEGEPYVLASIVDITERKRLEREFLQAQRMEAVGRVAGGVAHDFNNLLTAIAGYSELMLEDPMQTNGNRSQLEEILKAADRARRLTQQLLAFSRQQVLEPRALNPHQMIAGLAPMLRRLIREDVTLDIAAAPDTGNVLADPGQFEQVIMNLVVNARDAMPRGGTIRIDIENAGDDVVIRVADTGTGMSADTLTHLFEPFYTTKEAGKGTGLGLSTVYGIVKQSGGHIDVASALDNGTTFVISLPRVDRPAAPPTKPETTRELVGGSETVLLVEDDELVRHFTHSVLARLGYQVLQSSNAAEARALARDQSRQIDLLLADVVMPGESGPELFAALVQGRPELRVLYISGYVDEARAHHGVAPGAIVAKPFSATQLAAALRQALTR
jgi:PAS domain S-box-containing protein